MSISKETRQKVHEKYNGRCAYCGREIKYRDNDRIDTCFGQCMQKVGEEENMHAEFVKDTLIAGLKLVDTREIETKEVDNPSGLPETSNGTMRASSPTTQGGCNDKT